MHQRQGLLLLVDGEVKRAERLAKRLDHLDFDVRVADNGATALLMAHETIPDVVISAANLPILDGCRMLDALKSAPETSHIPVLLITEGSSQEEIARGWTAGADLCIPRNQGEADLLATLHRALSHGIVRRTRDTHPSEEERDATLVA
jgi:PleD family two-component response regulator